MSYFVLTTGFLEKNKGCKFADNQYCNFDIIELILIVPICHINTALSITVVSAVIGTSTLGKQQLNL